MKLRKYNSLRLRGYDYSAGGAYHVVICTHERRLLFGGVSGERVVLSPIGQIVEQQWLATGKIRPDVSLDEFVVMPNHIHGIIAITPESRRSRDGAALLAGEPATHDHTPLGSPTQTIGAIVRGFKAATTKQIRIGAGRSMQVWQRGY